MIPDYDIIATGNTMDYGKVGGDELVHRHDRPKSVMLVGVTENDELITVEKTRITHLSSVLELPTIYIEENENSVDAVREALLPLGYGKGKVIKTIKNVPINPGMTTESYDIVIIKNIKLIHFVEETENLKLQILPLKTLDKTIKYLNKFMLIDMKIYSSLYFLK